MSFKGRAKQLNVVNKVNNANKSASLLNGLATIQMLVVLAAMMLVVIWRRQSNNQTSIKERMNVIQQQSTHLLNKKRPHRSVV